MSDATKDDKARQRATRRKSGAKELRDLTILEKAKAGETANEIAEDLGVHRATVSKVLNSDEMKARIKVIDAQLSEGIPDAVALILLAVKTDYIAARDLLKNFGSMKQQIDLNHSFPKPTIIHRSSGDTVILGVKEDEEK